MYDADPFAARKAVADRQERAAKKEEPQQATRASAPESELDPRKDSLEVKLSTELRELVENAIKMVLILGYVMCICPTYSCDRLLQIAQSLKTHRH
jgi:ATP-dependent RNA helicase DHX57